MAFLERVIFGFNILSYLLLIEWLIFHI